VHGSGGSMERVDHQWRIRAGAILWFLGACGFLLALPMVLQAWVWLLPISVVAAAMLALPIAWLWARFVSKKPFRHAWLKWSLAILFLLAMLLAAPIYYFAIATQMRPALVPQVTLTNGSKRVVFQGMQHVGSDAFYKSVVFDLEDALSRGYVIYYEGVQPSTPDIDRWFDQLVSGGKDLNSAYRDLSGLCGLRFQSDYLAVVVRDGIAHPERHVVADVSTADLRAEYDRIVARDPAFADATKRKVEAPDTGTFENVVEFLSAGTDAQREMAGIVCRGFMTKSMAASADPAQRDALDPLILDYRNRVLADRLIAEPRHHIYLTYGSKHLPGLFALLRKSDPKWRVASVKWIRTIDSPQSYSASLPGMPTPK